MTLHHPFISKQSIDKGWSEDKKYCVTDRQGTKFLLRISPISQFKQKSREYAFMEQVADLGVPMSKPLMFGTSDEGVYSVQSWIDGADAEERMPELSSEEQFFYGLEAGRILKKIHQIPAPEGTEDWDIFSTEK